MLECFNLGLSEDEWAPLLPSIQVPTNTLALFFVIVIKIGLFEAIFVCEVVVCVCTIEIDYLQNKEL